MISFEHYEEKSDMPDVSDNSLDVQLYISNSVSSRECEACI